jgi:quinoprotein glucose dehydrogenase
MMARLASLVLVSLLLTSAANAQRGTERDEWHYYGGDLGSTRYAPLDQIDRTNAGKLEIAWRWEARNLGPRPDYNFRATPIMVKGPSLRPRAAP